MRYSILVSFLRVPSTWASRGCEGYQEFIGTTTTTTSRYYNSYSYNRYHDSNAAWDYRVDVTCTNVQIIELDSNLCTEGKCRKITFTSSNISSIPTNAFMNLQSLKEIHMASTGIENIETGAFLGLLKVETIHLEMNKISNIKRGSFNSLVKLKYLNLSQNLISDIENESFHGSHSIEHLDLSHNDLTAIPEKLLEPLKMLSVLNISHNLLQSMQSNLCHEFPSLRFLILDNNQFPEIDECIHELNIAGLSISNNFLTYLNISFLPKTIVILQIAHNNISEIEEGAIKNIEHLVILDISGNSFNSVPYNMFLELNYLQTLDISRNNISIVDSISFHGLPNLNTLKVRENIIMILPEKCFQNLSNLQILDLSLNNINLIPVGVLTDLADLRTLNISGNEIEYFESGVFNNLGNLQILDISHNKIDILQAHIFFPLSYTKYLYMGYNKLKSLKLTEMFTKKIGYFLLDINGNVLSCTELALIVSSAENLNIRIKPGNTENAANVKGIACLENRTSDREDDNSLKEFFRRDFKNSSFYKFFQNFKESSVDVESKMAEYSQILNYLQKTTVKNISDELHIEMKEFVKYENSSFLLLIKKLSEITEKLENRKKYNESDFVNSISTVLHSEIKSFIEFENTSFQKFIEQLSKIVDKIENKDIDSNMKLSHIFSNIEDANSEKRTAENKKEQLSATKDLVNILSQLKICMVLGLLILLCFCSVKMYGHIKMNICLRSTQGLQIHEMPILRS